MITTQLNVTFEGPQVSADGANLRKSAQRTREIRTPAEYGRRLDRCNSHHAAMSTGV